MKFFVSYIIYHIKTIAAAAVCWILFFAVFEFASLPIGALLYSTLLCAVVLLAFVFFDYRKQLKKHREYEMSDVSGLLLKKMPEADSIAEEDCLRLIELLKTENERTARQGSEKYNDMVQYYTVWAHQIKTPIAAMRLDLQNEDSALSRRLSSELFRVEQYVEMVMAFLRLDSVSTDYVFREHDIDEIVKNSVKSFAGEFISRRLRLEYEPLGMRVVTDDKWLGFVIEQVLSNALKYTREGSVKIYAEDQTLCIKDTGIGIAPEDLPRIFDKGYTGVNGREDKRASGLGLYLCRRICNNLGARIWAASHSKSGTCIYIDLSQCKAIDY